jgi:allophanate hydrolase
MSWSPESGSLDFATLQGLYASNALTPADVIRAAYARFDRADHVWITRVPLKEALARADELKPKKSELPLYGLPFAVKDSIDVSGLPTTGACREFANKPKASATVVDRLTRAGAIVVGKANLDQFGTGLVGVRSPYGPVQNPFDSRYISGGSSSGSAVAVSSGMVSFALGTDTAGSGRVPSGFNNIVGLKPTRGVLSYAGVLASCRTIDCVSVLALTCADARVVLNVAKGFDDADLYSRLAADALDLFPARPATFRFGVPKSAELSFFDDQESPALFEKAIPMLESMGGKRVEIDFSPFRETATLLYGGPWVAERLAALKDFYAAHADAFLPVTRKIIGGAARYTAVDTFEAFYALEKLKRRAAAQWAQMDFMLVPTTGTIYTIEQVEANPIDLNSNLGYYTNFVNLLDCSALAVPCSIRKTGVPF